MTTKELYKIAYKFYINGNYPEAANYLKQAYANMKTYTEEYAAETIYLIAFFLYYDIGFVQNKGEAKEYLKDLLRARPQFTDALWLLGHIYAEEGFATSAFELIEKGALLGDKRCKSELSLYYMEGFGVEEDGNKAFMYASAASSTALGKYALACLYFWGAKGFKPNLEWAEIWAEMALEQGQEDAQELLNDILEYKRQRLSGVGKSVLKNMGRVALEETEDYLSDLFTPGL